MAKRFNSEVEELVFKNQGLVRYIVEKTFNAPYNDFDDFVSIGNIGLFKAAQTFDNSKGIKFGTYATTCIKNEIRMYLRKQKSHANDISLDSPINVDSEGNALTLSDIISDSSIDFTEELAERDIFIRFINIILNLLTPRERLIMLYKIAGITQYFISQTLNISQSYVSRLEKKLSKKLKSYLNDEQHFKEVFSMSIKNDLYKISFSSKDVKNFNRIFAAFLQHSTSTQTLPDFNVNCNNERIVILLPAEPESFFFIAQIIQEIDNFNMTFVSDKNIEISDDEPKENCSSEKPEKVESSVIPDSSTAVSNSEINQDTKQSAGKKKSCAQQIIDYISTMDSFSIKQLSQHFPQMTQTTIYGAIQFAKGKSLIKSTTRGNYEVITDKDETPENDAVKING